MKGRFDFRSGNAATQKNRDETRGAPLSARLRFFYYRSNGIGNLLASGAIGAASRRALYRVPLTDAAIRPSNPPCNRDEPCVNQPRRTLSSGMSQLARKLAALLATLQR